MNITAINPYHIQNQVKKLNAKQEEKNNWFCIVIQVNGKIQETNKGD